MARKRRSGRRTTASRVWGAVKRHLQKGRI